MAIQCDGPVHSGIDNQATVTMCNDITDHQRKRKEVRLENEQGAMIIGGMTSHLHRRSLSKRPWALTKNGDLWESIEDAVEEKGPNSVKVTKVKGHATNEMVAEGTVRKQDKEGNDISDTAADRGAEATDVIAAAVGFVFARRHKFYKMLMIRIQVSIIKVRRTAEKEEREEEKGSRAIQEGWRKKESGDTEMARIREARR